MLIVSFSFDCNYFSWMVLEKSGEKGSMRGEQRRKCSSHLMSNDITEFNMNYDLVRFKFTYLMINTDSATSASCQTKPYRVWVRYLIMYIPHVSYPFTEKFNYASLIDCSSVPTKISTGTMITYQLIHVSFTYTYSL